MPIPKVSSLEKVDPITLQSFKSLTKANFGCFNQWLATVIMEIHPDLHKWKFCSCIQPGYKWNTKDQNVTSKTKINNWLFLCCLHLTYRFSSSPNPNLPSPPEPQENTTPSLVTTATWAEPQLTDDTSKLNKASINFGLVELIQSPCPRQPKSPRPQVITIPLSVTNTVKLSPQQTL